MLPFYFLLKFITELIYQLKEDVPRKQKVKLRPKSSNGPDKLWILKTIVITFTLSAVFNMLSSGVMELVDIWVAVLILGAIIFTGIVFDVIGVAVTTATEAPFHSMASRRVVHADRAIGLIKAKEKVSNFCNDVVGDICGIISGSASAAVVAYVIKLVPNINGFLLSLLITSLVAAMTVGGKAIGKSIAIRYSNSIVYMSAKAISLIIFWKR